jgi:hypothetical protein
VPNHIARGRAGSAEGFEWLSLTGQIPIRRKIRRLGILGTISMREYSDYVARVAECEQRAKVARNEAEKQSWLVMADGWRETAKLQEILKR